LPPVPSPKAQFGNRTIRLQWDYDTLRNHYSAFHIERSTNGTTYQRITKLPIISFVADTIRFLTHQDSLPQNNTTYYFQLIGQTSFGETTTSGAVSGYGEDSTRYQVRIIKSYLSKLNEAVIKWQLRLPEGTSSAVPIASYQIKTAPTADGTYQIKVNNIASSKDSVVLSNIVSTQYVVVVAIDQKGGITHSFPTLLSPIDTIPPAMPVGLHAIIEQDSIVTLTWTANSEEDLYGYEVLRGYRANEEPSKLTNVPLKVAVWKDTLDLKSLNSSVYFCVKALDNRFNQSKLSHVLVIKKKDIIPPTAPTWKNFKVDLGGIALSWIASRDSDVVRHILYRKRIPTDTEWQVLKVATSLTDTSYIDITVKPGIKYAYSVMAQDAVDLFSDPTTPLLLSVPTSFVAKPALENFTATVNTLRESIELSWNYTEPNVHHFELYKAAGDEPLSKWKILESDEIAASDKNITHKVSYQYYIRAVFNDNGVTNWNGITITYP
jgi:uncharacterized protein